LREEIADYMGHRTDNVAGKVWAAEHLFSAFEDALESLIGEFDGLGHDSYDQSLEIYGAPEDTRLSEEAQKLIRDAGFGMVYLNHHGRGVRANAWETIYSGLGREALPVRGWRRRYITDASAGTTREIGGDDPEERGYYEISYWPEGWNSPCSIADLERGYFRIVPDPLEPASGTSGSAQDAQRLDPGPTGEAGDAQEKMP
jgi:hypothetical protein